PVNTVAPKLKVNDALPITYSYFKAHSPVRRAFNQKSAAKTNNFNEKVNTARVNNVTTAGPKAVVSAAEGNRVKSLKYELKFQKSKSKRRRLTLVTSEDEEDLVAEDPSKQGRSLIEEIDLDAGISLVPPHVEVQGSTASPQRNADTTADDLTHAETLMKIRKSVAKDKGKAKMGETESPRKMKQRERVSRDEEVAQKLKEEFDEAERQRMAQVHQAAQGFTYSEWDDVLARVAADGDFVQQLQEGEKCSEEDLPMKLVELVN
ncbi:hypothetical protein Tco_1572398, partial [Tanacetum coccineum]